MKSRGLPWEKAKGFDGAAVIGKWVNKDNYNNLHNLGFSLLKNGVFVQNGNTEMMLWDIDELISYVSTYFTLKKGDVIFTGTPAGVGKIERNDYLQGRIEKEEFFAINVR